MGIQRDKLERSLGGIADMTKIPNMIFIIDTNVEELAVKESFKLNIPIVAIVDTNSDPRGISFPIPGNDDARRSINLYCELIKETIHDAQKNIPDTKIEDFKTETKKPEEKNKKEQKKEVINKANAPKVISVKKISKSILSKVKELTSKKSK